MFSVATRSLLGRVVTRTDVFNEVVEACLCRGYRRKVLARLALFMSNDRVERDLEINPEIIVLVMYLLVSYSCGLFRV